MINMKTLFNFLAFTAIMLLLSLRLNSDPNIYYYTYDAAGNRITRICTIPIGKSRAKDSTQKKEYKDAIANHDITIYPNPTKGMLTIKVTNVTQSINAQISVCDLNGITVFTKAALNPENEIDLSSLPNGFYFMNIIIDGKSVKWKIIKEE
jgi:hypothetical protein